MHVCGLSRPELFTRDRQPLSADQETALAELIARRQRGEPLAYLTGRREFWSLELAVSPATLIPRPETELLVERALAHIPADAAWSIADLGTGSGAIALAIAHERPRCRIIATDFSPAALTIARANADAHGLGVDFRGGDWLTPLAGESLDMVVSNPPYVRENDPHLTRGDARFEPRAALAAGGDGLEAIRRIVADARRHLRPSGYLLLEHGYDQAGQVRGLLRDSGYHVIVLHRDLAGIERVIECRTAETST